MSRIRTIKPAFFVNEDVAALPYQWRLLFVGLWTQADRDGRLEDRPQRLKAALFPYDDLNINDGLGCLANAGLIIRYEGNGHRLIEIPTWAKHQRPHISESCSDLPPPVHLSAPPHVGKGKERNGSGNGSGNGTVPALRARFDRFWSAYPKKVGKDAALAEWVRHGFTEALTVTIVAAVQAQCASPQWQKDGGQFIPNPRTWLHQGRWQDEPVQVGNPTQSPGDPWWWRHCPHAPKCNGFRECNELKATAVAS